MISYKIVSKNLPKQTPKKERRRNISPDDPDFKEALLERLVTQCHMSKGTRIRQAGAIRCGTITKMIFSAKECIWQNDKPYFIEVTFDDGEVLWCHPTQLTKKRVQ